MPSTDDASGGDIFLHHLTKSFRGPSGPIAAVRGVDLHICAGETVALLGPNGAGKSTTIDLLLGLLAPDAGTVSLFGTDPAAAISRGRVGAMLQSGAVIRDLTVRELIDMMASLYPTPMDVDDVLRLGGVADIADRRTEKLSGGQTQRVRFAVAMVSNPDLIVLDEPTVAMDVQARQAFWATMREFARRGKTVIFATHYLEEADAYADRIVLMAHGEIVADGAATELKAAVGGRTIRATLLEGDVGSLTRLPGVRSVDVRGDAVTLACSDSDEAIRALVRDYPEARDFEITGAGLEAAFLALTSDGAATESRHDPATESRHDPATEEIR